jgi:hypothetical protein
MRSAGRVFHTRFPTGLVIARLQDDGQTKHRDEGLYVNAQEFIVELEKRLTTVGAN